jgi:uncharacterized membrane protein (DUF373 family)
MKINKQELRETEKAITDITCIGSIVAFAVMILTTIIDEFIVHSNILQIIAAISLGVILISILFICPLTTIIIDIMESMIDKKEKRSK